MKPSNYVGITGIDNISFEDAKSSIDKQEYFGNNGLYFCGFHISATGLIREIELEAKKIAKSIANYFTAENKR